MAGSSIVTILPTRMRLPVPAAVTLGAAEVAGEPLAVEVGDDGELVLLGPQPVTRASATSAADNEPNRLRDVVMGQPSSRGRRRAAGPRPRIEISTSRSDRGSRIVQIRGRGLFYPLRARERAAVEAARASIRIVGCIER